MILINYKIILSNYLSLHFVHVKCIEINVYDAVRITNVIDIAHWYTPDNWLDYIKRVIWLTFTRTFHRNFLDN